MLLGCICISSAYDARGTTPAPTVRGVSPSAKIGTVFRPCFWDRFLIWKSKSNVWVLAIGQPRLHRYEMAGVAICSSALRKRRTHLLQKSNGRYRQTVYNQRGQQGSTAPIYRSIFDTRRFVNVSRWSKPRPRPLVNLLKRRITCNALS